ncbi:DUF4136 domain-containing protein [Sulfurimonas diazotrophicus]|uniref:DUF4136 domain-containing protein n=1 Tax=Sulfurimonas diazotrophicus TaxID=3131939 RepID=A0ABZ3HE22_9BACT
MFIRIFSVALLLLLAGCSSLQVQSDYDPKFDFTPLERFAVVYPRKEGVTTLTQSRIAEAITAGMTRKGYTAVAKEQADFILIFHTDVTTRREVTTDFQMVGFFPYYGYGYGASMTVPIQREYEYDEAQIIIDALNPDGNKIFWRAATTDRLKSFDTPEERTVYINELVAESLKTFPQKRKAP